MIRKLPTTPSQTAFFVCDIQERFRDMIYSFSALITTAQKMIKAANILGVPFIVTEHYPKTFARTVSELDVSNAALRVEKTKFSMFVPEVADTLKRLGTKSVVIFGIESHVCVLQTALDLLEANYDVHVLSDCVSSSNFPEIDIALTTMRDAGAVMTTSESVLLQLMNDDRHDRFEEVSKLVMEYQEASRNNPLLYRSLRT